MASRKKEAAAKGKAPDTARPLTARNRDLIKGPPAILGWSHFITPDEAFGNVKFKADFHYNAAALSVFCNQINEAYWALVPDIQAIAAEAKKKIKVLSKAEVFSLYREERLKNPSENAKIQIPYVVIDTNASYRDKDGQEQPITIKAYDPHGAPLDLKTLRLGMESVVKPVFQVSVWAGPLSKGVVMPKLRLIGVQVLKLKQYGNGAGNGAPVGEVTAEDLALLEKDFSPDDLSMFSKPADASKKGKAAEQEAPPPDEMDDDIPF